jgi:hypothetical protein
VRHELADVVRDLRESRIEPLKGRVLVYALSTLAEVIKGSSIEQQLRRLEAEAERVRKETDSGNDDP